MGTVIEWYTNEAQRGRIAPEQCARRLNPERSPYFEDVVDQSVELGRSTGIKGRIVDEGVAIESLQAPIAAEPDKSRPILRNRLDAVLRQAIVHREVVHMGSGTLRSERRRAGTSQENEPEERLGHWHEGCCEDDRRGALRQGSRMT